MNGRCPCDPDVPLVYDHVTDSDFEDDVHEQLALEYSYAVETGPTPPTWEVKRQSIFLRQPSTDSHGMYEMETSY